MNGHKQSGEEQILKHGESGFTIIEVTIASVITMIGLISLASLFTLAISQNKLVKQHTATTSMAQQKLEELNARDKTDTRMSVGGSLNEAGKVTGYWDEIYVDDKGTVSTTIPSGQSASYKRYWQIEADPQLAFTVIISVRVVATQASRGRTPEETTLVSIRSY